jgi:hypothetical protein
MRKFKIGLITLAASAALLMPIAGNATAATQNPSSASASASGCLFLCYNWYVNDNIVAHDVDIVTTASWCDETVQALSVMGIGAVRVCPAGAGSRKVKRTL